MQALSTRLRAFRYSVNYLALKNNSSVNEMIISFILVSFRVVVTEFMQICGYFFTKVKLGCS
jgi:hypothetical protein